MNSQVSDLPESPGAELVVWDYEISVGGTMWDQEHLHTPRVGRRRWILSRIRSVGSDAFAIPAGTASATLVCAANPSRVGGSIVNTGANPLFVYLADPSKVAFGRASVAAGFLVANGSWDFRISKALWSGDVSVISPLGTTIAWAQL